MKKKVRVRQYPVPAYDMFGRAVIAYIWTLRCPHCGVHEYDRHWECVMRQAEHHATGICSEINKIGV